MKAQINDTVRVHYTGKTEEGEIFDSSLEREPIEFVIGKGNLLKPFEDSVVGLKIDESVKINIPCEQGYGAVNADLVAKISRENLGLNEEPKPGMQLQSTYPDGREIVVRITEVDENEITIDANHPLAGKNLNFEITLVEIKS